MYDPVIFVVKDDFIESAIKAIQDAYTQYGHAPREVMVQKDTDTRGVRSITVKLGHRYVEIPVRTHLDLQIGLGLSLEEAAIDVSQEDVHL